MYQRFSSDMKKKGIINIKLIIIHILCNSFFQKASPKTSSEDWQNVIPILSTGKRGEKKTPCQRSHHICNGTPQSQSTDHVDSTSRHHTFKHTVSLMKNTLVFENHFESNKYRGKCLFRRRGEINLRWGQEVTSLRKKRETATDWLSWFRLCPGFGWDRVNFLPVAGIVQCFGFSMRIMLITHWWF